MNCEGRIMKLDYKLLTINYKQERGFSIVELIVIIAVLGILVSLAIPNFIDSKQRARVKVAKGVVDGIRTSLEMYSNEYLTYHGITPFIYPHQAAITNLDTLYRVLSPYITYNPKTSLGGGGFALYQTNAGRSQYTLTVKAPNRARTPVTATRGRITAVFSGEEVSYP